MLPLIISWWSSKARSMYKMNWIYFSLYVLSKKSLKKMILPISLVLIKDMTSIWKRLHLSVEKLITSCAVIMVNAILEKPILICHTCMPIILHCRQYSVGFDVICVGASVTNSPGAITKVSSGSYRYVLLTITLKTNRKLLYEFVYLVKHPPMKILEHTHPSTCMPILFIQDPWVLYTEPHIRL